MSAGATFSIFMLMFGCCANVISLEAMLFKDSKCGSLVTICQFIMLTIYGFITNLDLKNGKIIRSPKVPMYYHLFQVFLFFTSSVLNNLAFGYNISMPLHSLIRSGSLAMNMVVGVVFFKYKVLCVSFITLGILITTMVSSNPNEKVFNVEKRFDIWIIGITMLFISLVLQASLGNAQQYAFQTWKSDANESVFYSHLFSLPFFYFLNYDLIPSIAKFNQSEPIHPMFPVPYLWIQIIFNAFTQILCVLGVHRVTAETNSLTATLIITIRKFVSLLISVTFFDNNFQMYHWIGTIMVFGGSIWYWKIDKDEKEKKE